MAEDEIRFGRILKVAQTDESLSKLETSVLETAPTLLFATDETAVVFRIKGLSKARVDAINAIGGRDELIGRCRAIRDQATAIEYETYLNPAFLDNLDILDSGLPKMMADLVKTYYFEHLLDSQRFVKGNRENCADSLPSVVERLRRKMPYAVKRVSEFCEVKITRFLRACVLGMKPTENWRETDGMWGGYVAIFPDGHRVPLSGYYLMKFEHDLFRSTLLEQGTASRHGFLTLEPDGDTGDYLLKLNFQIRFLQ